MKTILFLGLVFVAYGEAVVYDRSPREDLRTCTKLRCEETGPLADRLSKLSLLPDFVTQTLLLLEDLMKEMDTELQRSASYLIDKVGPECSSTYHTLNEVLKKQRMRQGRKSSPLGFGIEPMDEEVKTILPDTNNQYGEPEYISPKATGKLEPRPVKIDSQYSEHNSGNKWQSGGNSWNQKTRGSSGHKNEWSRQEGSGHGFQASKPNRWSKKHELGRDLHSSQSKNKWSESKVYGSDSHSGGTSWQTEESSGYGQWDDYGSSTQQHTDKYFDKTDKYTDSSSTSNCRGVGKSSPFWVPGLDSWCVQNCAMGYCPETHCVC